MPLYEVEQETERVILVGVSQQDGDDAEDSVAELQNWWRLPVQSLWEH